MIAFGGKGFVYRCKGPDCEDPGEAGILRRRALREAGEAVELSSGEAQVGDEEDGLNVVNQSLPTGMLLPAEDDTVSRKVTMLGDTWTFDVNSDTFRKVLGDAPKPRWKPSSTVTVDRSHMVLFGGCKTTDISGVMNDLWVFTPAEKDGGSWARVYTANPPSKRRGHIAVANSTHLIVLGGKGYDGKAQVLTDMWAIPLASIGIGDAVKPKPAHGMALDITFGGKATANKGAMEPSQWTQLTSFPGGKRWGATGELVKGAHGKEMLAVFGGRNLNSGGGFHSVDANAYTYYNELWLYDFEADKWETANPTGPAPHPRDHHGATELEGELYIFGGRVSEQRASKSVLNDLWSYSLQSGSWTLHEAHGGVAPNPRYMPGVSSTVWKGRNTIAVFGGETLPGSTKTTSLNDMWLYDGKSWHEASPVECSAGGVGGVREELAASLQDDLTVGGVFKVQAWAVLLVAAAVVLAMPKLRRRLGHAQEGHDSSYLSLES